MTMRTSIQKNRGLLAATAVASITLLAGPLGGCAARRSCGGRDA